MKFVLDIKDFCTKINSDEKDYNIQFYRYLIYDVDNVTYATVWFSQKLDSGNIYSVSVRLKDDDMDDYFDIYIKDDNDSFYPEYFEISASSVRLTCDSFSQYKVMLDKVYDVANTVMQIFKQEEHTQYRSETKDDL